MPTSRKWDEFNIGQVIMMDFVDLFMLSFGNLVRPESKARDKDFGICAFTVKSSTKTLSNRESSSLSASNREDRSFLTCRVFMAQFYVKRRNISREYLIT